MSFDLVLRGGTVVSHRGIGAADIGVTGGRIMAVGDIGKDQAGQVMRARRGAMPACQSWGRSPGGSGARAMITPSAPASRSRRAATT